MSNLWPEEIEYTEVKAPVTILKEQASYLKKLTKNIITAEVENVPDGEFFGSETLEYHLHLPRNSKGRIFIHTFYLVAPALNDYHFSLFSIINQLDLYPVWILLDQDVLAEIQPNYKTMLWTPSASPNFGNTPELIADSENQFLNILKKIFTTQRTKTIISSLIAQSVDVEPA